jgi:hypothetical protein
VAITHFIKETRDVENADIQIQKLENTIGLSGELHRPDSKDKT